MKKRYESEYKSHNGKKIKMTIIINNPPSDEALMKFSKEAKDMIFNDKRKGK